MLPLHNPNLETYLHTNNSNTLKPSDSLRINPNLETRIQ